MRGILFILCFWLAGALGGAQAQTTPAATRPAPDSTRPKSYTYTETLPVFPGREPADSARNSSQRVVHFLNAGLVFPPQALRDGVTGKVYFSFKVDNHGHTTEVNLVKGLREDVNAEIMRNAHRLDTIQWKPGTQNGRPITVSFTVPISFNINNKHANSPLGDSLDLGRYDRKPALPRPSWESKRWPAPKGQGMIYGTCLQRLAGANSLGTGEYVRLVNLTTHKLVSIGVKPPMKSRRENSFFYALPAGRYALHMYAFPDKVWGPYRMHFEDLRKPVAPSRTEPLRHTRYQFTVESGKVHYVGTWNLANENQPEFLNEKYQIDPAIQTYFPQFSFKDAIVSIPE